MKNPLRKNRTVCKIHAADATNRTAARCVPSHGKVFRTPCGADAKGSLLETPLVNPLRST